MQTVETSPATRLPTIFHLTARSLGRTDPRPWKFRRRVLSLGMTPRRVPQRRPLPTLRHRGSPFRRSHARSERAHGEKTAAAGSSMRVATATGGSRSRSVRGNQAVGRQRLESVSDSQICRTSVRRARGVLITCSLKYWSRSGGEKAVGSRPCSRKRSLQSSAEASSDR